jgi:hypothetical protein
MRDPMSRWSTAPYERAATRVRILFSFLSVREATKPASKGFSAHNAAAASRRARWRYSASSEVLGFL